MIHRVFVNSSGPGTEELVENEQSPELSASTTMCYPAPRYF